MTYRINRYIIVARISVDGRIIGHFIIISSAAYLGKNLYCVIYKARSPSSMRGISKIYCDDLYLY